MLIILNYLLVFILILFFKLSHTMKNFLLLFLLILGCSKKQNSGFNALWTIKEVNVNYFQRPSKSRATSFTKIPMMIFSFLINFVRLKNQLNTIK